MAYYDVALLSSDGDFTARNAAAYSIESLADPERINPSQWANENAWTMSSQPGFGDAYASALAGGVPNPGRDPAVITDGQILSAVQSVLGAGVE